MVTTSILKKAWLLTALKFSLNIYIFSTWYLNLVSAGQINVWSKFAGWFLSLLLLNIGERQALLFAQLFALMSAWEDPITLLVTLKLVIYFTADDIDFMATIKRFWNYSFTRLELSTTFPTFIFTRVTTGVLSLAQLKTEGMAIGAIFHSFNDMAHFLALVPTVHHIIACFHTEAL